MASLRTLTTSLTLGLLLVAAAPAAHAGDDGYASMLGYLTNSRIDGQAMSGTSGSSAVNMAAGDFNQQANLRAFAVGGAVSIHSRQQQLGNLSNAPSVATASIGGSAYANGSGLASINQASGNGNAQVNAVAAVLAAQGIRESSDGGLSMVASTSAGEQHPSTASGTGTGVRSAAVESSAMQGFQGVMQLNQAAGSGNATSNQLLFSLPTSP